MLFFHRLQATVNAPSRDDAAEDLSSIPTPFLPVENVQLSEDLIRRNEAVAAAIPYRLSIPSLASEAVTQRTDATCRTSTLVQYAALIKAFAAPGVLKPSLQHGCRSSSVWILVNEFCASSSIPTFKNAQVLSRTVNSGLKKSGASMRIITKMIQKNKSRHVRCNINLQSLAGQLKTRVPPAESSDDKGVRFFSAKRTEY